MAGATINLKTDYIEIDDGGVVAALERLIVLGQDPRAAYKDVGEYLLQVTEERFDTETGPGGIEWPDVTAETRKRKKHPKILTERGDLRRSFSYDASSPEELVFGTNVVYAAAHQFGISRTAAAFGALKRGAGERAARSPDLPARPFLGFDDQDGERVLEIFLDHIDQEWWRQ